MLCECVSNIIGFRCVDLSKISLQRCLSIKSQFSFCFLSCFIYCNVVLVLFFFYSLRYVEIQYSFSCLNILVFELEQNISISGNIYVFQKFLLPTRVLVRPQPFLFLTMLFIATFFWYLLRYVET